MVDFLTDELKRDFVVILEVFGLNFLMVVAEVTLVMVAVFLNMSAFINIFQNFKFLVPLVELLVQLYKLNLLFFILVFQVISNLRDLLK